MGRFKPVLDNQPEPRSFQPVLAAIPPRKTWCFSFQYWRQEEFFGLNKSTPSWFVSLLERFQALSTEEVEHFLNSPHKKARCRYHGLDWNRRNVPVRLEDLDWIPAYCRDNPVEFPLVQFQISKGMGRVIGFWDRKIFNVVFLDPYHNMQPSKYTEYKLRSCDPLGCDYTKLLHAIEDVSEKCCKQNGCECAERLASIETSKDILEEQCVVMLKISASDMEYVEYLRGGGSSASLHDIFKFGLDAKVVECMEASEEPTS